MEHPALRRKERSMELTGSNKSIASDVLHFENHSKLSAEEIAKAVAHHNRHRGKDSQQTASAKVGGGKAHSKTK